MRIICTSLQFEITAVEFNTQKEMDDYLTEHPGADKNLHWVKEKHNLNSPPAFSDEQTGYHDNQSDLVKTMKVDGKPVGKITFSEYEGVPHVQYIEVSPEHRGKGYGKTLLKKLQEDYPNQEIDLGMTTDDGTKMVQGLKFKKVRTKEYPQFLKLKRLKETLVKIDKGIAAYNKPPTPAFTKLMELRDSVDRDTEVLEDELYFKKPYNKIIV